MRVNELMLYRHMEQGQVLNDMAFLMENYDNEYYNKEDLRGLLFDSVNEILELAVSHGLTGNLWHDYLTFLLASDENAYSTSCEIVGAIDGSMNQVAMHDFAIFKELYDYDFTELEKALGVDCMSMLKGFEADGAHGSVFNKRIRDRICELQYSSGRVRECQRNLRQFVTQFYKEFGVGKFGLAQSIPY